MGTLTKTTVCDMDNQGSQKSTVDDMERDMMATVSSTASAGKRPSAHAAAKHVCLLEADEKRITDAQASSASSQKGRKRSIDETVVKMLKDNFKGFTEVNTDLTISNGSSLR